MNVHHTAGVSSADCVGRGLGLVPVQTIWNVGGTECGGSLAASSCTWIPLGVTSVVVLGKRGHRNAGDCGVVGSQRRSVAQRRWVRGSVTVYGEHAAGPEHVDQLFDGVSSQIW